MTAAADTPARESGGPMAPFRHRAFALLWLATVASNVGTWMHDVGAGWLMTELAPSPALVAAVQAATTLPIFLFALLAGAVADILDRKADDAAGDIERVATAVQHPRKPIERRVGIGAPHRLVQCGDEVVESIPALVEPADRTALDAPRHVLGSDLARTFRTGDVHHDFEQHESAPAIAVGYFG